MKLIEILKKSFPKDIPSNASARRAIEQGSIRINDKKVLDVDAELFFEEESKRWFLKSKDQVEIVESISA